MRVSVHCVVVQNWTDYCTTACNSTSLSVSIFGGQIRCRSTFVVVQGCKCVQLLWRRIFRAFKKNNEGFRLTEGPFNVKHKNVPRHVPYRHFSSTHQKVIRYFFNIPMQQQIAVGVFASHKITENIFAFYAIRSGFTKI